MCYCSHSERFIEFGFQYYHTRYFTKLVFSSRNKELMFQSSPFHGHVPSLQLSFTSERMIHKLNLDGRAYALDPSTGHHVSLCHLDTHHVHAFHCHPALRGIQTLTSSMLATDDSHFYNKQLSAMHSLPGQTKDFRRQHLSQHSYGYIYDGTDVAGRSVRKTATRDNTGLLKVWLNDHKKNPYPTKSEKTMLAIITRMTLTQVSTWFANARRRLKKDRRVLSGQRQKGVASGEIDSDKEGDVDCRSLHVEVRNGPRTGGQLSSEGEGDPTSDFSDEENDTFLIEPRDNLQTTSGALVPVKTSSSNTSQSETIYETSMASEGSNQIPGSSITNKLTSKPKIWSISNILYS